MREARQTPQSLRLSLRWPARVFGRSVLEASESLALAHTAYVLELQITSIDGQTDIILNRTYRNET